MMDETKDRIRLFRGNIPKVFEIIHESKEIDETQKKKTFKILSQVRVGAQISNVDPFTIFVLETLKIMYRKGQRRNITIEFFVAPKQKMEAIARAIQDLGR